MNTYAARWTEELNDIVALQALLDRHPGWTMTERTGNGPMVDITDATKARLMERAAYYRTRLDEERGSR
jgi:hypothetical protein